MGRRERKEKRRKGGGKGGEGRGCALEAGQLWGGWMLLWAIFRLRVAMPSSH